MLFFFEHHGMKENDFFRVNELRGRSFPAHLHRAYELIYVMEGGLSLQIEDKNYTMTTGDLAFIFHNQIHHFSAETNCVLHIVLFSPEIVGSFYSLYRDYVPENNVIHLCHPVDFFQCESIYAQKSLLYQICDRLLKSTKMEKVNKHSQTAILQQVFAYVDANYDNDCSLKDISRAIQYDYAYLSKLFVRMTKMKFTEYLNNYRISQACYLLMQQQDSILNIAEKCGYTNLRSFHRNFRRIMECSPTEYLARYGCPGLVPGLPPFDSTFNDADG